MTKEYKFNTDPVRSHLMSRIKSINTTPEIILRKKLWSLGYRYRLNCTDLPGKPDIVCRKKKLVIFVDGEFWHGHNWEDKKQKIKANRDYWIPKIENNIARDKKNNEAYENIGWTVLRFWEHQIKKELNGCVSKILEILESE